MQRPPIIALSLLAGGILSSLAALALAPPAASNPRSPAGSCFLPRLVNGFHAVDRDTIEVTVGVREVYRLELLGTCPDVDWSTRVGIRSTHGATWVCQGEEAELLVPAATGIDRCPVTGVRKLSAEEVAAEKAAGRQKH
jgi:hypothetical protein